MKFNFLLTQNDPFFGIADQGRLLALDQGNDDRQRSKTAPKHCKGDEIAAKIVDGLLRAGKTLADMVISIAQQGVQLVSKIVEAAFALGTTLIGLLKDVVSLTMNLLKEVVKAAFELGKTVAQFVQSMVEFTYRTAARFIEAALEVGATVMEMLETVVEATYFVFRKIVNGILQALGPVGDIFEWLLDRGEALASSLWREAVLAVRFVKKSVTDIMDWALAQTDAIFDRLLELVEDIGTRIADVIEWAQAAGELALQKLGEATIRVGNSIGYVLSYLETDFLPGIAKIVEGAINAGMAVADLVTWAANRAVASIAEVLRGALAVGRTLGEFIAATIEHPDQVLDNFLQAARDIGQTLGDVFQAVIIETAEQFLDEVVRALVRIGEAIVNILVGVLEIAFGAVDTVIIILFQMLGSYRTLTAQERAEAQLVYADSIDLDKVFIAIEDPFNSIVFGVQDFCNQLFSGNFDHLFDERPSRAFVTGNLINFDADEDITRHTLIHELCHVWQNQNVGPVYMAHAIGAQIGGSIVGDDAYNYGYDEGVSSTTVTIDFAGNTASYDSGYLIGLNGEAALNAEAGDFSAFNPEAQGQIAMHYYVRKFLLSQSDTAVAPWQQYIDVVQAGRPPFGG